MAVTKTPSRRSRRRSKPVLHPERMWELFRRAGWFPRLVSLLLLLLTLLGLLLLGVPFTIDRPHPEPPPLTLRTQCPPSIVAAVAGSGGVPNPVPSVPEMAETHDADCVRFGRSRSLTGLLLTAAGLLNSAAVLEWARLRRRAKRRRRRSRRPES